MNKIEILRTAIAARERITVTFAGAGRAYRSGSAPRYRLAAQYKHTGVFRFDGDRVICEGMEFSRHPSKISGICGADGAILFGNWCPRCKVPAPQAWGNCPRCTSELRSPTKPCSAMPDAMLAAREH